MKLKLWHLVAAFVAYKLLFEESSLSPRGDVDIGDAEDRSNPSDWANPYGGY